MTPGPLTVEAVEREQRDRDETRRLLYAAILGIRAAKPVSVELAATIVNAIVHHARVVDEEWAEQLALYAVLGDHTVLPHLHDLIDRINSEGS